MNGDDDGFEIDAPSTSRVSSRFWRGRLRGWDVRNRKASIIVVLYAALLAFGASSVTSQSVVTVDKCLEEERVVFGSIILEEDKDEEDGVSERLSILDGDGMEEPTMYSSEMGTDAEGIRVSESETMILC